jgi:hypothetical protein
MRRAVLVAALGLLVAACAAEPPGYEGPFKKQVRAAIPVLEEASGLRFLRLPVLQTRSRDQVRSYLEQEFNAQLTPAELAGTATAYRLLGLLPDTLDLRAFLLDLLTEQVAGYYDPKTKVLYVVDDASAEMRDITITHELMHALQDQHTDLTQIDSLAGDNDRMVAMQAVVEGQAVYEQLAVMTGGQDGEPKIPGGWGRVREMIREGQSSMPKFSSAPMLLQETLLFPYLSGAEFVRQVKRARPGIAPFSPFAVSTEQILHPERYLASLPDLPTRVSLGAPRTGTLLHEDNLGEFETRLLLYAHLQDEAAAVRGAAGWDGDRYQVIETASGPAFAWVTVWDTEDEAAEFAQLFRRAVEARYGPGIAARRITIELVTIAGRAVVRYEDAPGIMGSRALIALDRVALATP